MWEGRAGGRPSHMLHPGSGLLSLDAMSNSYNAAPPVPPAVTVTAGTAIKIGFFGALGAFLLWLIVSVVLGIVGIILAAAGLLAFWPDLPR